MTLADIDARTAEASHALEVVLLRAALVSADWSVTRAAESLSCPPQTLSDRLARHPALLAERQEHGTSGGRPRKPA